MPEPNDQIDSGPVQRLLQALVSEGIDGFDRLLDRLGEGVPEQVRQQWVVLCADRAVYLPRHRGLIVNHLGRAIDRLNRMGDTSAVLLGLTAAAQIQLADGVDEQVPDLLGAIEELARRTESLPYQVAATLIRAQQAYGEGNASQTAQMLDEWTERLGRPEFERLKPLVVSTHVLRVQAWATVGHLGKLKAVLRDLEASTVGPSSFLLFHRGLVAEMEGRQSDAISDFQAAAGTVEPDLWAVEAHLALARLQPEQADVHLERARELAGPDHQSTSIEMTRAALRAGRYQEAQALAEELKVRYPTASLLVQAEVFCTAGPPARAIETVDDLMDMARRNGLAALEMQAHLFAAGLAETIDGRAFHIGRARRIATEIDDLAGLGRACVYQAMLQIDLEDGENASKTSRLACEIGKRRGRSDISAAGELALGLSLKMLGDSEQGRKHLEHALEEARRLGLDILARRASGELEKQG